MKAALDAMPGQCLWHDELLGKSQPNWPRVNAATITMMCEGVCMRSLLWSIVQSQNPASPGLVLSSSSGKVNSGSAENNTIFSNGHSSSIDQLRVTQLQWSNGIGCVNVIADADM